MDLTPEEYCRRLESYLCRKNDGHLVRIVGPAFEQVCGWADRGVPLKVAERGIDRYFDRYYSRGPRRRPVRIEFCEADVLDLFDEWRRAVGIAVRPDAAGGGDAAEEESRRHTSLPAHVDRVIARLTALRAGEDRSLDAVLEALVRELDAARAGAKGVRGAARAAFVERLRVLDRQLIEAALSTTDSLVISQLEHEADAELQPFRERMPAEAYAQSRRAAVERALRERRHLPILAFD